MKQFLHKLLVFIVLVSYYSVWSFLLKCGGYTPCLPILTKQIFFLSQEQIIVNKFCLGVGIDVYLPFSEMGLCLVSNRVSKSHSSSLGSSLEMERLSALAGLHDSREIISSRQSNLIHVWTHSDHDGMHGTHTGSKQAKFFFNIYFIFWKFYTLTKCIFIMSVYYYWPPTCPCVPRSASFSITTPLIVLVLITPESN